jgi:hypothetical protein
MSQSAQLQLQEQPADKSSPMALSKNSAFSFLKGSKSAGTEIRTPLETVSETIQSFASYTTGTVEMKVTPEIMDSVKELRTLSVSSDFRKLAEFVQVLQADFPMQDNLLVAFLNPMKLATEIVDCETPQDVTEDVLQRARWQIELQGDHALIDGLPIWDRLEGERVDFYNVFKLYRDSRYGLIDTGDYTLCTRSMAGLARHLNLSPRLLDVLNKLYNWKLRCAYYDRFFEMEIVRKKQLEVQMLQRDHLKFSTTLLDKAMSFFEMHSNQLTPKDAISLAELGFKISRLSLGMMPDRPAMADGAQAQPLLAVQINQQTQNTSSVQVNQQQNFSSEAERQLHENLKDNDNLLSILHVLQRSGAMDTAITSELADSAIDVDMDDLEVLEPRAEQASQNTSVPVSVSLTPQAVQSEPPQQMPAGFAPEDGDGDV